MRIIVFALIFAVAAACVQAAESPDSAASAPEKVQVHDGRVTLVLTNAPLAETVEQLFKLAGKPYTVLPMAAALMESDADRLRTNIHVTNLPFDWALKHLLEPVGLGYVVENGVYTIMTAPLPPRTATYTPPPQLVTISLPAVPVEKAYEAVIKASEYHPPGYYGIATPQAGTGSHKDFLGWQFADDLGKTTLPGARFVSCPPETAAAIVVAAAGLTPPPPGETLITRKGQPDPAAFVRSDWSTVGGAPNIGSYRTSDGEWLYFIRADQAWPTMLARELIPSTVDYVIDEPPAVEGSSAGGYRVSVRLTNVTLDQALQSILPPAGYTYRVEKGAYFIEKKKKPDS